jgi:hypothetical protein
VREREQRAGRQQPAGQRPHRVVTLPTHLSFNQAALPRPTGTEAGIGACFAGWEDHRRVDSQLLVDVRGN